MGDAQTLSTMSPRTSPSNGSRPVIAAKVHAPSDQRSVSGPGAPPMASCSGAMKFGVPMTVPSRVGPPIVRFASPGLRRLLEDLRDAEVDQLDHVRQPLDRLVGPREEDVVRLEIAVDDARGVRLGERARRLADDLPHLPRAGASPAR